MGLDGNEGRSGQPLPFFVQYAEWLRLCLCSVFLFLVGGFLPLAGVVVAVSAPTPLALIGLRQGLLRALLGVSFCSALIYIPFGEAGAISFVLGSGLLGAGIAFSAKKCATASEAIFLSIIASVSLKVAFMGVIVSLTGQNPFLFDETTLQTFSGSFGDIKEFSSRLPLLIPTFITLAAGFDAFVNYFLTSKIEQRKSGDKAIIKPVPPFAEWKFPKSLLFALFAALLIPLFEPDKEFANVALSVELNLKIVVNILFFIQGLSFVWWWTKLKNFPSILRGFVIALVLVPIFSMGLIAVGIGDIWLDLRERIEKKAGEKRGKK